jgi:hypothetical protein
MQTAAQEAPPHVIPPQCCAVPGCRKLLASTNRSGFCTAHHRPCDRLEKRLCVDCGVRLRSDTPEASCLKCRVRKLDSRERKVCSAAGCGKVLYANNQSGYCPAHHHFQHRHEWIVCNEPGCQNRVHAGKNKNGGFCRIHRYAGNRPSIKKQICKEPECSRALRSDNTTGYCKYHTFKSYAVPPRFCSFKGCSNCLGTNNKSGLCGAHLNVVYHHEHKEASRRRTEEYRVRLKQRLAKANRVVQLGAPKKRLESKAFSMVGQQVEDVMPVFTKIRSLVKSYRSVWQIPGFSKDQLSAAVSAPNKPLVAARYFVAHANNLSYETVAEYHREYRKQRAKVGAAC